LLTVEAHKQSDKEFTAAEKKPIIYVDTATTTSNQLSPKVRTATSTEQFSHAPNTHLFTLD